MKIGIERIDISQSAAAAEVLSVQLPAYKVEAALIGFTELPPLKETIEELQQSVETFYGFYTNGELNGVISLKIDDNVLDIYRLVVHPKHFRKGIAQKLLAFVQIHENKFEEVIVATASSNRPAILFYLKNGFTEVAEVKTIEGLVIKKFSKFV